MKRWLLAAGFLLATCATCAADRLPADPEGTPEKAMSAFLMNVQMNDPRFDGISYNVKNFFSECSAKYLVSKMSEGERAGLQSRLRAGTLEWNELAEQQERILAREGRFTIDKLTDFCPAYIPGFKKYYGGFF